MGVIIYDRGPYYEVVDEMGSTFHYKIGTQAQRLEWVKSQRRKEQLKKHLRAKRKLK